MKRLVCCVAAALLAAPVIAGSDAIQTDGTLTDRDFYNLISCGAAPGGPCIKPHKRWLSDDAQDLTVSIAMVQDKVPDKLEELIRSGLSDAMGALSAATDNLKIRWAEATEQAKIEIFLVNASYAQEMTGTGRGHLDGQRIANAQVASNRTGGRITYATIAFSRSLDPGVIRSIALEEMFQALGFVYDIDNPSYRAKSLLDEHGSEVEQISGQDLTALRLKYAY